MTPYYDHDGIVIHHARCEDILPTIPASSVDLLLTDPPYGINMDTDYGGRGRGSTKTYARVDGDDAPFNPAHLLDYGKAVLWGANNYADKLPPSPSWLVWNRLTHSDAADAEVAWTNLGGTIRMYTQRWDGRARGGEEQTFLHPTQKPIGLMLWVLYRYTKPGDLILDPYMGSGPVARAAHLSGRQYIGIECVEEYCQAAVNRLAQPTLGFEPFSDARGDLE